MAAGKSRRDPGRQGPEQGRANCASPRALLTMGSLSASPIPSPERFGGGGLIRFRHADRIAERMNICHVITRLIVGGAQENTVLSCRGLAALGHDVTLIAGTETGPEGSLWEDAKECGVKLLPLPVLQRAVHPISDIRAYSHLIAHFRELRPDVVHTHSSKAGILGRAAAARVGVPMVVHTIHGMSFNRTQRPWTQWAYRILEREAAKRTHKIITVADAMIEQSVAAGIARRDQLVTIRSGLQVDRFKPDLAVKRRTRASWGVRDEEIVVGTIARLFANKGYDEIIKALPAALARNPRLRFVWVGDGANRDRYKRELHRLGILDRVVFTGLVPPGAVPELLQGFDLLVHASQWEGLPRAVVQALLMEVPVVCFDNDGAPEVVLHQTTGILVPLGDVDGLAEGIIRLAADSTLRSNLGSAGRQLCLEQFDERRMVDQLDALYRELWLHRPAVS